MAKKRCCSATGAPSSRGQELPKGKCKFNKGRADGTADQNLVPCRKCGRACCRDCLKKLRLAARAEVSRCQQYSLLSCKELNWLLTARERSDDLFDVAASDGVLVDTKGGGVSFVGCCPLCFNFELPTRSSPVARLPRGLALPLLQPDLGRRVVLLKKVRAARSPCWVTHMLTCDAPHSCVCRCRRSR